MNVPCVKHGMVSGACSGCLNELRRADSADWIRIYDDALPAGFCDALRKLLDDNQQRASRLEMDYRRCLQITFDTTLSEPLFEEFKQRLAAVFRQYRKEVKDNGNLDFCTHMEVPSILKYEPGGRDHFHLHADNWNTGSALRQVSVVVYLNDVIRGGRTIFPEHGCEVDAVRGRIVIFPSFYLYPHRAEPPVSGSKYAAVTWMCLPPLAQGDQHYRVVPV